MFGIPHPTEHHTVPRNNRTLYCVIPSFHLFPGLFSQSFLGRTPTRRGSREEKLSQSWIGFLRRWNMDLYCHLHLVGINTGSLHSGILFHHNGTKGI